MTEHEASSLMHVLYNSTYVLPDGRHIPVTNTLLTDKDLDRQFDVIGPAKVVDMEPGFSLVVTVAPGQGTQSYKHTRVYRVLFTPGDVDVMEEVRHLHELVERVEPNYEPAEARHYILNDMHCIALLCAQKK